MRRAAARRTARAPGAARSHLAAVPIWRRPPPGPSLRGMSMAAAPKIGRPRKRIRRTCGLAGCGKGFDAKPSEVARGAGIYCSRECRQAGRRAEAGQPSRLAAVRPRAEPKVKLVCAGCGERFRVNPHRDTAERQARFCSARCRSERGLGADGGEVTERDCANCGEPFRFYASGEDPEGWRGTRRHCSRRCRSEARVKRVQAIWDRAAARHPSGPAAQPTAVSPSGERTPEAHLASLRGRSSVLGMLLDRELAKPQPDAQEVAWLRSELAQVQTEIRASSG